MDSQARSAVAKISPIVQSLAAWGPGLLVMLADTDAGNVVAAAQAGAQWRFRLLPLILALIPALYLVQELAARLGLFTGQGFGELARKHYGKGVASIALAGLALAAFGTLITEFTAFAGVGELYGLSRDVSIGVTGVALVAVAATGSYRKVERVALVFGLFECAFLIAAWKAHPNPGAVASDILHSSLRNSGYWFLAAAIVGAVFNPWMVFFQQSATARIKLRPEDFAAVRTDTAVGAVLTQVVMGAVLIATAAALYSGDGAKSLSSVGEVGEALSASLGRENALLVYSLGVLGASFAAAIVASLALSWAVAEVYSTRRGTDSRLFDSPRFLGIFVASVIGAAALVRFSGDLVWLNIAAQVANALIFPLVIGLLIAFAVKVLAPSLRLRGLRLAIMIVIGVSVGVIGLIGTIAGFM